MACAFDYGNLLAMALDFGRARDIAQACMVSRGIAQRCAHIVSATAQVEALLCNTSSKDEIVEAACSALRVQTRPNGVLVLYTRFPNCRTVVAKALKDIVQRGLLPRGVPAYRAKVSGVIGRTASGVPLEVESGPGVLFVVVPEAIGSVAGGLRQEEPEEGCLGHSAIISGSQSRGSFRPDQPFPGTMFGGVADGKTEMLDPSTGEVSDIDGITISWRQPAVASKRSPCFSAMNVQAMGRHPSHSPEGRIAGMGQLVQQQRDAFLAGNGGSPPRAIALFACCARGSGMYFAPSVEAKLLHDAYSASELPSGPQAPPLWGMFCQGELGPAVDESESESESDSEDMHSGRAGRDVAVSHQLVRQPAERGQTQVTASRVKVAGPCGGGSPQEKVALREEALPDAHRCISSLQGFTSIVGVFA